MWQPRVTFQPWSGPPLNIATTKNQPALEGVDNRFCCDNSKPHQSSARCWLYTAHLIRETTCCFGAKCCDLSVFILFFYVVTPQESSAHDSKMPKPQQRARSQTPSWRRTPQRAALLSSHEPGGSDQRKSLRYVCIWEALLTKSDMLCLRVSAG